MFSASCANPECGAPFDYRRGRLLQFYEGASNESTDVTTPTPIHFWLCDRCSIAYTIQCIHGRAVLTRIPVRDWLDDQRRVAKTG